MSHWDNKVVSSLTAQSEADDTPKFSSTATAVVSMLKWQNPELNKLSKSTALASITTTCENESTTVIINNITMKSWCYVYYFSQNKW